MLYLFTNESWQLWIWGRFPPSKCPTMAEKQTICCWSYLDLKKKRMTVHKSCITMVITSSASVYYRLHLRDLETEKGWRWRPLPSRLGRPSTLLPPVWMWCSKYHNAIMDDQTFQENLIKLKPPCFSDRTLTCLEPLLLRVHWLPLPLPLAGPCTNLFGRI